MSCPVGKCSDSWGVGWLLPCVYQQSQPMAVLLCILTCNPSWWKSPEVLRCPLFTSLWGLHPLLSSILTAALASAQGGLLRIGPWWRREEGLMSPGDHLFLMSTSSSGFIWQPCTICSHESFRNLLFPLIILVSPSPLPPALLVPSSPATQDVLICLKYTKTNVFDMS